MVNIQKNFVYKLFSNFTNAFVNGLISLFLPKLLGPYLYGNYSFLITFFRNSISFLDIFLTPGFYVLYNKEKKKEFPIVSFIYFFLALLVSLFFLTIIVFKPQLKDLIFINQDLEDIYIAFTLAFINWLIAINSYIFDANNKTVFFEKYRFISRILLLLIFFTIYYFNKINVTSALIIFVISNFVLIIITLLNSRNFIKYNFIIPIYKTGKKILKFNSPLIILSSFSLLFIQIEITSLNYFYGSEEFSFFSLSVMIGSLIFIFTASLLPLIIKKFVENFNNKDFKSISDSFSFEVIGFFYLVSFLSIFVAIHSSEFILVVAGEEYMDGLYVFMIYSLFPIHQTLGQVSSAFFLSTERAKDYANINIIFALIGFLFSLFLILPNKYGGLELGSFGLAIKMVFIQLFSVYYLMFIIYKTLKLDFLKLLLSHFKITALCVFIIFLVREINPIENNLSLTITCFIIDFFIISFFLSKFHIFFELKKFDLKKSFFELKKNLR